MDITYIRYPYTANHILESLEQVLEEWKIRDLVFTITTDNGSNVKKAIQDMEGVNWLGCTAHTLQLVIGKGMKLAEILIARIKRLIDFFLQPKQSERLEDVQQKFPELVDNDSEENKIVNNFFLIFF